MFPPSISSIIHAANSYGRHWEANFNGIHLTAMGLDDTDNLLRALPALKAAFAHLTQSDVQSPPVELSSQPHPKPLTDIEAPYEAPSTSDGGASPGAEEMQRQIEPTGPTAVDKPPHATDLQSVADWHLDQYGRRECSSSTVPMVRRTLSLFIDIIGNKDIAAVDFRDMEQFANALAAWPRHAFSTLEYKNQGAAGVIKKAAKTKMDIIKKSTQESYLQNLSAFFNHAMEWKLRSSNPVLHINRRREYGSHLAHPKRAFTNPEWCLAFNKEDMSRTTEPHKFFGMLLLAYTGARPNEIAQLKRNDIRMATMSDQEGTMHDVLCMHIGGSGQATKSSNAARVLPIPTQVMNLGFEAYLTDLDALGATELFPGLQEAENRPGASLSQWFNTALRRRWKISDPAVTLYCFRHSVSTMCTYNRVPSIVIDSLLGHSSAPCTTTSVGEKIRRERYDNRTTPLDLRTTLEKLPFPNIDAEPYRPGQFAQYLTYELARLKDNAGREAKGEERIPRRGRVPKAGAFRAKEKVCSGKTKPSGRPRGRPRKSPPSNVDVNISMNS